MFVRLFCFVFSHNWHSKLKMEEDANVTCKKQVHPRKFTWKELSHYNRPHNAHVAYRGKVNIAVVLNQGGNLHNLEIALCISGVLYISLVQCQLFN